MEFLIFLIIVGVIAFFVMNKSKKKDNFKETLASLGFTPHFDHYAAGNGIAVDKDSGKLALMQKGSVKIFERKDVISWNTSSQRNQIGGTRGYVDHFFLDVQVRDVDQPNYKLHFFNQAKCDEWYGRLSALYA